MNNCIKGALPKDKNNNRSPQSNLTRHERRGSTPNSSVDSGISRKEKSTLERATPLNLTNEMKELTGAMVIDEVSSGYDLAPKPKVPCIPLFQEHSTLGGVCSLRFDENDGIELVYKGKDIEESSISVLFVGSTSRIELHKMQAGGELR